MKGRLHIILFALMLLLPASCRKEGWGTGSMNTARLEITVYLPQPTATRAETGAIDADRVAESTVNTLQIWVFQSLTGEKIGYLEPSENNLQSGNQERYAIYIEEELADAKPDIDVYVLANGAAAGLSLDRNSTRSELADAVVEGSFFGTSPVTAAVPAEGLPMAGVLKNASMEGSNLSFRLSSGGTESVAVLERLVSKLRFVFCQMAESGTPVADFEITGISLDGSLIASKELVFNTTEKPYSISSDSPKYVAGSIAYAVPDASIIAKNTAPLSYRYSSQTAQGYEDLINGGISSGVLTEWGRSYFRESDKGGTGAPFGGTIRYTVDGGSEKTVNFRLDAAGDFARNHSWIIYAYFIGGKIVVQPVAMPWIAGHDYYNYTTQGQTVMGNGIEYLRYDLDGLDYTWYDSDGEPDTWMCVSYSDHSARPLYSTAAPIRLETDNEYTLVLQTNNSHFLLQEVLYNNEGAITGYATPASSITITPNENGNILYFYIVAASATLGGHSAYGRIFLTAIPPQDVENPIPPYNIPYNHLLPGTEGHTAILVYDPLPATFLANKDNTYDSTAGGPQFWWVGE